MLVPLMTVNHAPRFAEVIWTPRPEIIAPVFEKGAMTKPEEPFPNAATEIFPSETAGGLTAISKSGLTCL